VNFKTLQYKKYFEFSEKKVEKNLVDKSQYVNFEAYKKYKQLNSQIKFTNIQRQYKYAQKIRTTN
jgi:hypothetical protein